MLSKYTYLNVLGVAWQGIGMDAVFDFLGHDRTRKDLIDLFLVVNYFLAGIWLWLHNLWPIGLVLAALPIHLLFHGFPFLLYLTHSSAQVVVFKVSASLWTLVLLVVFIVSVYALIVLKIDVI